MPPRRRSPARAATRLLHPVEANELFVRLHRRRARGAARAGLRLLRLGRATRRASSPPGTPRDEDAARARPGDRGAVSATGRTAPPPRAAAAAHRAPVPAGRADLGFDLVRHHRTRSTTCRRAGRWPTASRSPPRRCSRWRWRCGSRSRIPRRGHLLALAIGLSQFCGNFNFVYRAELHLTSGIVAVLFALLMVPNALFGRVFLGQRITARFLARQRGRASPGSRCCWCTRRATAPLGGNVGARRRAGAGGDPVAPRSPMSCRRARPARRVSRC